MPTEGCCCLFKPVGKASCEMFVLFLTARSRWNLDAGSLALQRTWLGREVYSKTMGGNMKKLIEKHHDQVSKNQKLDFERIRQVKYLHEFDREIQGPTCAYKKAPWSAPLFSKTGACI